MPKVRTGSSKPDVPLRKVSYEERVEVGREIASRIVKTCKDAVLAICIYGSTAKNLDRPYSDLEIFCVVTDRLEIANKFYVYHGLLVEIDYLQESNFLKSASKMGWDWPIQADQYRNRIVLFEKNGWLGRLVKAVAENDKADFTEPLRAAVIGMTESLSAVRNAQLMGDSHDLKTRAFYMAWDTAKVVLLLKRKYVLTTSRFWKQLFECEQQPKEFRKLIDIVAGFEESTRTELTNAIEELWQHTMEIVRPHGVLIESTDIIA